MPSSTTPRTFTTCMQGPSIPAISKPSIRINVARVTKDPIIIIPYDKQPIRAFIKEFFVLIFFIPILIVFKCSYFLCKSYGILNPKTTRKRMTRQ